MLCRVILAMNPSNSTWLKPRMTLGVHGFTSKRVYMYVILESWNLFAHGKNMVYVSVHG